MNLGSSLRSIGPWPHGFWSLSVRSEMFSGVAWVVIMTGSLSQSCARPLRVPWCRRSELRARSRHRLVPLDDATIGVLRRPLHRPHDGGVAGAPADLSGDRLADLVLA